MYLDSFCSVWNIEELNWRVQTKSNEVVFNMISKLHSGHAWYFINTVG